MQRGQTEKDVNFEAMEHDMEVKFEPAFFRPEVREGFYITSVMKHYWAAQLVVLAEIDRICEKYEIPWFADCGTLMGAIRHAGFIPWDDDIDIAMLRDDFVRFSKAAKQELPSEMMFLSVNESEEYKPMTGRVVSQHAVLPTEEYLDKYRDCPFTVGVDIFPLDGLAEDEEEEQARCEKVVILEKLIEEYDNGKEDEADCKERLDNLTQWGIGIDQKRKIAPQLRVWLNRIYSMYPSNEADNVALMLYWPSGKHHRYETNWFRHTVRMPFENVMIPVPAFYEDVLRVEYGDYMMIRKGGGAHEYPLYKKQERILERELGKNPLRYRYKGEKPWEQERVLSLEEQCTEILDALKRVHALSVRDFADFQKLLPGCQELMINLGERLEKKSGVEELIRLIEDYCEAVYNLYESGFYKDFHRLEESFSPVYEKIKRYLKERKKDALFICYDEKFWQGEIINLWRYFSERESDRVNAVKISGESPDINLDQYDIIVIQNPYDGRNLDMMTDRRCFAENLKDKTGCLVYVPCFEPETPIDHDDKAYVALRELIEQPATVWADHVLVSSEKMRDCYVDTMTGLAGETSRLYWMDKILLSGDEAFEKILKER